MNEGRVRLASGVTEPRVRVRRTGHHDGWVMRDLSPSGIRSHIAALDVFDAAYAAYLAGGRDSHELRQRVIEATPAADEALVAANAQFVIETPPMLQPPLRYSGLANTAFLHEHPGFRPNPYGDAPTVFEQVVYSIHQGRARLVHMEGKAKRQRRRPTYWIDRALRALLLIPAYLVSLIVGRSALTIDRSAWGLPLRLLAVVADALGAYGGGKLLGLW